MGWGALTAGVCRKGDDAMQHQMLWSHHSTAHTMVGCGWQADGTEQRCGWTWVLRGAGMAATHCRNKQCCGVVEWNATDLAVQVRKARGMQDRTRVANPEVVVFRNTGGRGCEM
jgi:hypothetical protein